MNGFTRDEIEGRLILEGVVSGKCHIEFTEHPYDGVDGHSTGNTNGITSTIEIKNRDISEKKYNDALFEMTKFMALQKDQRTNKYDRALFVTIFHEHIYVWDVAALNVEDLKWRWMWCTETTAENYGEKKVLKLCSFLKFEDALWVFKR